jgi:hypothetical protein
MSWDADKLATEIKSAIAAYYPTVTVGVVEFDTETVLAPAALIIPVGITNHDGSLEMDDQAMCQMQISCIGQTTRQTASIQAAVYRLLMGQTGGGYTAPLLVEGRGPLWREVGNLGPIIPGDQVYRTNDTYAFKVRLQ